MTSPRTWFSVVALATTIFFATACGGGGGGGGVSGVDTSNDLLLLDLNVADFDGVALNTVLEMLFSEDLDPDSVRPETIQIRKGPQFGSQVFGHFRVDGDRVFFYPRLPVDDKLETSGFQAGTDYKVYLPSVPHVATVRNYTSDRTIREAELFFKTALADDPDLFIDNFLDPGPPRILNVNPVDGAKQVPASAQITLTFNRRPLDPRTVTEDTFRLVMVERKGVPNVRTMAGKPVLTQSLESVQVVFQPTFPLPDEAKFELTVSNRVEDLVGFSIASFTSTFEIKDEAPRLGQFRLEFTEQQKTDLMEENETTASWNEITADALSAIFTAAGGSGASGDLVANADRNMTPFNTSGVDLNQYEDGVYYDVFNFRKFEIYDGVTVRIQSSKTANPVKVLSVFPMKIDGVLTVTGGTGEQSLSYQYANTSSNLERDGGTGGPGGADGGQSYDGTAFTNVPQPYAPDCPFGGYGGQGGGSGTYNSGGTYYYSYQAGGGGGGGSRLAGEKGQDGQYPSAGFWGKGGAGGLGRSGNFERKPNVGGAGGGPGGYGFYRYSGYTYTYYRGIGAGGGGGGGGLWLQSASKIQVYSTGQILAEGGKGGATYTYYVYAGGAGGGGGGGSIKASSTLGIELASGAKLSVDGGTGGASLFTYYPGSAGGKGGVGFLRFEAPQPDLITGLSGADLTYTPPSIGTFAPVGGGVPSIGQTRWQNLGVFDPEMLPHKPLDDRVAELSNDGMEIFVQMCDEHPTKLGEPDLTDLNVADDSSFDLNTMSEWTKISDIEDLTGYGYQFIRMRIVFQLDDNQRFDDPLPYLDRVDVNFRY